MSTNLSKWSIMTSIKMTMKKIKSNQLCSHNERLLFTSIFIFLVIILILLAFYINKISDISDGIKLDPSAISNKDKLPISFKMKRQDPEIMNASCNFFNCFNVYQCGTQGSKLLVYVYPIEHYTNFTNVMTREYHEILQSIISSQYYTLNPDEACIFVPSIDLLFMNNIKAEAFKSLHSLEYWNGGENHLIFTTLPITSYKQMYYSDYFVGKAMIAASGHSAMIYRTKFDISLPIFSPLLHKFRAKNHNHKKWLVIASQINIDFNVKKDLLELKSYHPHYVKILNKCDQQGGINISLRCDDKSAYKYPDILQTSTFCLLTHGDELGKSVLIESLATGCIPVIIHDALIMPFEEVLDWTKAAVFIREVDILKLVTKLQNISNKRIKELRNQGSWLYGKYFKSTKTVTETALEIIADRVFVHLARNYLFWNVPNYGNKKSPLQLPITVPKSEGFTAVILTYDRVEYLFSLVTKLSLVPSLTKIIVIWNNQVKKVPKTGKWPKINKPLKIIQTNENILSNRFYPYDEIETEAILSIDDDILMLTEDEVEFAYEVWREFPDRIVGFPSRIHKWDNKTFCWKYESEWTNEISMVLTGAAFYHKYWNYAYTLKMPGDIRQWVDSHMNCEDIAMNFLVSNITRKAPIKVTARKKFRCPECTNTEMLSADLTHMVERTQCINHFATVFGYMPLIPVEFRADPVLYKDNFPEKLKRFNNIGSL